MSYLLSIELRQGDHVDNTVGEIVLLEQSWAHDLETVLHEFTAEFLTGERFRRALQTALDRRTHITEREIEADPRRV